MSRVRRARSASDGSESGQGPVHIRKPFSPAAGGVVFVRRTILLPVTQSLSGPAAPSLSARRPNCG